MLLKNTAFSEVQLCTLVQRHSGMSTVFELFCKFSLKYLKSSCHGMACGGIFGA